MRQHDTRLLDRLHAGDTLVVVRIDRLARSLSHLLVVIEQVRDAGGHFRSLGDPIDTTGPSGMLVLQIMGAIAQFERALIVERTKAGLAALIRGDDLRGSMLKTGRGNPMRPFIA